MEAGGRFRNGADTQADHHIGALVGIAHESCDVIHPPHKPGRGNQLGKEK